ncbi:hypothetical protein BGZ80_008403 [Entomortierella chlamydospora]|uniref:F-box domain-containing protein n=1 Tax=Entomortierella chlamydospora TaxID=101097 RepID=A0A9P6MXA3_9FUNG|nr:hypothetical protein BGZ79_008067 [Entomortierella chlamydospora]KAG0017323.1 hypothetical protein BGZ80_008403 [Entomortierella chlamydospora]
MCNVLFISKSNSHISPTSNPSDCGSAVGAQSTAAASAATQIPEVLWEIFSYLSHFDLRYSVSGVNRLWYSISSDLIQDEIHWKDTFTLQEQDMCLARMGSIQVKTLHCLAQDRRTYLAFHQGIEQDVDDAWKKLSQTISALAERKNEFRGRSGSDHATKIATTDGGHKLLPWKRIVYSGWNYFNDRIDPLIRQHCESFHGVRLLHLKHLSPGAVDLSCVFSSLLYLEELVIESSESFPFTFRRNCTITWKERNDQIEKKHGVNHQQQPPLRLHTFKLRHLIVNQDTLEMLIGAFPNLHTLDLKFMISNARKPEIASIDRSSLVDFLAQQCPNLTHFHFSISGTRILTGDIQKVHVSFPNLSSLSIPERDVVPGSLDLFVDRLTSLEIECFEYGHDPWLGDMLHTYMCQAPLLLHLKAYRTRIHQEHFILQLSESAASDPFRYVNPQDAFDQPIWACRNLKTLYLLVGSQHHVTSIQETATSRRVFGYISRVCPNLEDLAIERTILHTEIKSGLSLLSRCKKLRRLRTYTNLQLDPSERDLDWICLGMTGFNSINHERRKRESIFEGIAGALCGNQNTIPRIGRIAEALFGRQNTESGIGGVSKSEREMWVDSTIQSLKKTLLQDHPATDSISRLEEMSRKKESEGLDPIEMTTLDGMEHLICNLQILLQQSIMTSRNENRFCCWPNLETFEMHQMASWATPAVACQDMIYKLRPDLRQYRGLRREI